ncbi:HMA, heavy metal-associated [Glarea lozoyensis ATCC 20868]|uniref:HMA, heavy metal-associated n=1 Tax=Glarea lozoyensis (strain ATCC 20868 / MF5171) TaxID=1116229 RepID=S3EFU1_GLAL2|nr:HMA, heavy metal-associated [Glarea lozoyensis ATCC 20868]EPE37058.1 HMA, heavy metal-associated [Glarea lozoyensis ATCC 20868]
MSEHNYKFDITMSCGGCSGAVNRVLGKLEGEFAPTLRPFARDANMIIGVKSYEVSLETQTAKIVAEESLSYEKVLQTIQKTGKKVTGGEADGEKKSVDLIKAE